MAEPLLTSRDEVYDLLRDVTREVNNDELIDRMVRAASEDVRDFTNRKFTSPPVTETRRFLLRGRKMVYLEEVLDPTTVTAVVDISAAMPRYRITTNRSQRGKGCYLHIDGPVRPGEVPADHADYFITEFSEGMTLQVGQFVDVTATYGYVTIPPQISYQTARTARTYFSRESSFTDTQFVEETGRSPEALPSAVAKALESWVVPDVLVPA